MRHRVHPISRIALRHLAVTGPARWNNANRGAPRVGPARRQNKTVGGQQPNARPFVKALSCRFRGPYQRNETAGGLTRRWTSQPTVQLPGACGHLTIAMRELNSCRGLPCGTRPQGGNPNVAQLTDSQRCRWSAANFTKCHSVTLLRAGPAHRNESVRGAPEGWTCPKTERN